MTKKTKQLQKQAAFYIQPTIPFNFKGTFFKPSHFPSKLVHWTEGKLLQGIRLGSEVFGLVISNATKTINQPRIQVDIYSRSTVSPKIKKRIKSELIKRYDTAGEVAGFIEQFKSDDFLSGAIERWEGMRPSTACSFYGFLMVTVVLQNATVKRSIQMMDKLLQKFGTKIDFAGRTLFVIWQPKTIEKATEKQLRDLKVGYRAKIIKKISHAFTVSEISENELRKIANREEVKERLLQLYGVGPQSVSYILFEVFHFYDTPTHIPSWERKIFSKLIFNKKIVSEEKILATSRERWGKWGMLALHYLFEDLFWKREQQKIPWLEKEIRM